MSELTHERGRLCTCVLGAGTVRDAARHVEAHLAVLAPDLVEGFRAALPHAAQTVGQRLLGALCREDIGDARERHARRGRRHAFDRVEFDTVPSAEPADLLPLSIKDRRGWALAVELTNAAVNLALAYARRATQPAANPGAGADAGALSAERLAVDGHNLHPCGRTRLGWDVDDVLAHDLEADSTWVGFVAVRDDLHTGDDVGAALAAAYPQLPPPPPGYLLQPVHAWQRDAVLAHRYADLVQAGAVRLLDAGLPAAPTAALRTLLLPAGADGRARYLKLSLDVQVTSTRRTISVASTRNGPALSAVLEELLAGEERLLLLAETAGAAMPVGTGRDLSAILRTGLDGRLAPGERAVPGGALPAVDPATGETVLTGLVRRYGRGALAFFTEYARLLLPPVLRLATRYGIALEAHLQNCLPTFVDGAPHRLALRDFAGLRVHRPRLAAAGVGLDLWPGSVIGTDDAGTMRAKVGYTALQAHLGELVVRLAGSHGLDEAVAWRAVRGIVDETYDGLRADPTTATTAAADHAALTAALVPHKALVRMRLAGEGDVYLPVRNPLHAA